MAENARQEFQMNFGTEEVDEKETRQPEETTVVYSEMTAADRPIFQWLKKMMIFGFIAIFVGVCVWQVNAMKKESEELDQTIAQLEKQIDEEKAKELEIKVEQEYYQSIAYREQMARDRCKLIYPNEILISIQNKN